MPLTNEQLSEYDLIFCIDTSGSMQTASTRFEGKNRLGEGEELIQGFASIMEPVDTDGFTLITFGAKVIITDNVKASAVHDVFTQFQPYGSTPMHTAIEHAVNKAKSSSKKTICVVLTDGAPDNRDAVEQLIINQANSQAQDEDFTFLFIQVGGDEQAAQFLDYLDDDLPNKGAKFDIVDAVKASVAETMMPADLLEKAIND